MPNLPEMSRNVRYFLIGIVVLLIILLGFLREFVFVNINYQLHHLFYETDVSHMNERLSFLDGLNYRQMYIFKWVLTGIFSLFYFSLSAAVIYWVFQRREFVRWTAIVFAGLIILAGLFFAGGYLVNEAARGYSFSRDIMGWVQSPFVLMVLVPAFKLFQHEKI